MAQMVNACNAEDLGLIPGLGRPPAEGMANHSSIPGWRIPWTEEPGGLQTMGSQSQTQLSIRAHTHQKTKCVKCFNPIMFFWDSK